MMSEKKTFKDIKDANDTIITIPVKDKQYAEVNQRIKAFRMLYPEGSITTEILSLEGERVVMKATITNGQGVVLGTGTAYEKEGSTFINKTSFIENCETSAVGRALAMCGIGIDVSVASAEEVQNAIAQQNDGEQKPKYNNFEIEDGNYMEYIEQYFRDFPDQLPHFLKTKKIKELSEYKNAYTLEQIDRQITKFKKYEAVHKKTGIYSEEETF